MAANWLRKVGGYVAEHILLQVILAVVLPPLLAIFLGLLRNVVPLPLWLLISAVLGAFGLGLLTAHWRASRTQDTRPRRPGYGSKWIEYAGALWHFHRQDTTGSRDIFRKLNGPLCPTCQGMVSIVSVRFQDDWHPGEREAPSDDVHTLRVGWQCAKCGKISGEIQSSDRKFRDMLRQTQGGYEQTTDYISCLAGDDANAKFAREEYEADRSKR